jgi:hypothetical protein
MDPKEDYRADSSALEGAQWLAPLGCAFGFIGGVIIAGISAGVMCFRRGNPATWGEVGKGFLIVLAGAVLGPIGGFIAGSIWKSHIERSIAWKWRQKRSSSDKKKKS